MGDELITTTDSADGWAKLAKAAFKARRAVENFHLTVMDDDPVQYVVDHNGYGGHNIYADESWRYKGRKDWIVWVKR